MSQTYLAIKFPTPPPLFSISFKNMMEQIVSRVYLFGKLCCKAFGLPLYNLRLIIINI